jgi:hypothetical protein
MPCVCRSPGGGFRIEAWAERWLRQRIGGSRFVIANWRQPKFLDVVSRDPDFSSDTADQTRPRQLTRRYALPKISERQWTV